MYVWVPPHVREVLQIIIALKLLAQGVIQDQAVCFLVTSRNGGQKKNFHQCEQRRMHARSYGGHGPRVAMVFFFKF